jgi:PAS domain S-box-containing protein
MKRDMWEDNKSSRLMEEAEQTLHAIRQGAVDAFVVEESDGHRVYTLEGSDLPYSALVERMQQGAAMLDARGCIIYCNLSLAALLESSREAVIGRLFEDFLTPEDRSTCQRLLHETQIESSEGEMRLRVGEGKLIPANFSFSVLSRDRSATGVLITDLTVRKQQADFALRLQNMQDEERKRIARELHDSVGQLLAAVSMNIGIVQSQAHLLDSKAARAVSDNAVLVEQVSSEIRTISHLLHPPLLDLAGLVSALRWYVDGFSERSKIKVGLEIADDFGRLPGEMEIAIFRIVQECLTNIHRHSGSSVASILLRKVGNDVTVRIRDSGKGIPEEKQRELTASGLGFGGMRERVRQLGGTLEIRSDATGTVISTIFKVE